MTTPRAHLECSTTTLDDCCSYTVLHPGSSVWWWLGLAAWSVVGVPLALLRIGVLLLSVLLLLVPVPASLADMYATLVVRFVCVSWGLVVRLRGDRAALRSAAIVVANHRTQIDTLPLRAHLPIASVVRDTYQHSRLVRRTCAAFEPIFVPTPSAAAPEAEREGRARVRAELVRHLQRPGQTKPLVIFPEGSITNGAGLMVRSRHRRGGSSLRPLTPSIAPPAPSRHTHTYTHARPPPPAVPWLIITSRPSRRSSSRSACPCCPSRCASGRRCRSHTTPCGAPLHAEIQGPFGLSGPTSLPARFASPRMAEAWGCPGLGSATASSHRVRSGRIGRRLVLRIGRRSTPT